MKDEELNKLYKKAIKERNFDLLNKVQQDVNRMFDELRSCGTYYEDEKGMENALRREQEEHLDEIGFYNNEVND